MAITWIKYFTSNSAGSTGGDITSGSFSVAVDDIVIAMFSAEDNTKTGSLTISNTGTALSWTPIGSTNTAGSSKVAAWWAKATASESITVSVLGAGSTAEVSAIECVVHTGAHLSTPVPAGNVYSGVAGTDVTQAITPTASGSALWMIAADYGATNSFAAAANCTLADTFSQNSGLSQYTTTFIRPTTQPRTDANAFTIGESDTSGTISWIAFEVQAAGSGGTHTATGNGTVTADGGADITERGVCWNTTGTPTTADSKATSAGTTGAFTAPMTALQASTHYYVRAYAINAIGTSYGSEVTFDSLADGGGEANIVGVGAIASAEAIGSLVLSVMLSIAGIASSGAIGQPTISPAIATSGIPSQEALGSPGVSAVISPAGIASQGVIGQPTIAITLSASGIASSEAVGQPTISVGIPAQDIIDAGGIPSAQAFGSPSISVTISTSGVSSSEGEGSPSVSISIIGAGNISSAEAIGQPTISVGATALIVDVGGIPSEEAIGQPTITAGQIPAHEIIPSGGGGGRHKKRVPWMPFDVNLPVHKKKSPEIIIVNETAREAERQIEQYSEELAVINKALAESERLLNNELPVLEDLTRISGESQRYISAIDETRKNIESLSLARKESLRQAEQTRSDLEFWKNRLQAERDMEEEALTVAMLAMMV